MSPITGLARLPGRIFVVCSYDKFQPGRPEQNLRNTTKMVEHRLVSFAAVVALKTLVTLLLMLIRILLRWENIQDKNYAILAPMLRKQNYFVEKGSSRLPELDCSYGKILIPVSEISVDKTKISVTGPAELLI